VVSFKPQPLCPRGKSPRYPLDRRLGGAQNRSGHRGDNEIPSCPLPVLNPERPAHSLVSILTALPRFPIVHVYNKSRDSSLGIALGYGLDDRGSRVRFPAAAGNFSLHHYFQNGSGAHPVSYSMGSRSSFPEGKAAGA
jgi:hypothetical protein